MYLTKKVNGIQHVTLIDSTETKEIQGNKRMLLMKMALKDCWSTESQIIYTGGEVYKSSYTNAINISHFILHIENNEIFSKLTRHH